MEKFLSVMSQEKGLTYQKYQGKSPNKILKNEKNMQKTDVKCVIFDLDGTLLNTIEDLTDSINFALEKYNFPQRTSEECMKMVGSGKKNFALMALPAGKQEYVGEILNLLKEHYLRNCTSKSAPYEQIEQILDFLKKKGVFTAVMTNKDEIAAVKIVKHYFGDSIDTIIGASDKRPLKPDPAAVLEIIEQLGLEKNQCIFIGDSEVDIQTGKAAKIYTVAASWGFRSVETIKQFDPDVIIDKPIELLDLIESLTR